MKITIYNQKVAKKEGKKKSISLAQISEVNKINDELTGGMFYAMIRTMPDRTSLKD